MYQFPWYFLIITKALCIRKKREAPLIITVLMAEQARVLILNYHRLGGE